MNKADATESAGGHSRNDGAQIQPASRPKLWQLLKPLMTPPQQRGGLGKGYLPQSVGEILLYVGSEGLTSLCHRSMRVTC